MENLDQFDVTKVAQYDVNDRERLLANAGIILNKLKINATIFNAQKILELQKEYGSFSAWLDHHHPLSLKEWTKLFRRTFKFTDGEITNEFLMSTGYLSVAHHEECEVYQELVKRKPPWNSKMINSSAISLFDQKPLQIFAIQNLNIPSTKTECNLFPFG